MKNKTQQITALIFRRTIIILSIIALAIIGASLGSSGQGGNGPAAEAAAAQRPSGLSGGCPTGDLRYSARSHFVWTAKLVGAELLPARAKQRHRHFIICSAGPNHTKVMKKRWKQVKRSLLPKNHSTWVRIGRCEQPGSGYAGIRWDHPGPTYQGGLGFYHGTWDSYKPGGYPDDAGQASWREQMITANRVVADVGLSAWGCHNG